jgi:haloalkane dehalogenase
MRRSPAVKPQVAEAIEQHRRAGREFEAGGVQSFVREQGEGDPVVLMHGIPASSFLYRKVLPLLADRGLRGVAFDLPGLGLAERPRDLDYTWTGLGRWTGAAIDALGIERCHLVLHDIGGPIAMEWAARNRDRVKTLTVLDTLLAVDDFRRHWTMAMLSPPLIGRLLLETNRGPAARWLFYSNGIGNRSATPAADVDAYFALLRRGDGGRAFQRIVRGFEPTAEKERLYLGALREAGWPAGILWGDADPALGEEDRRPIEKALGVEATVVPAKHFLQEDQAPAVADAIAGVAASG